MRVHSTYKSELFYGKSAKKTDELKLIFFFFLNDHFLLNFTNFYVLQFKIMYLSKQMYMFVLFKGVVQDKNKAGFSYNTRHRRVVPSMKREPQSPP